MKKPITNYAFIDNQNVYLGFQRLGWKLDWRRFRIYLEEKYAVKVAYQFLGFLAKNQALYRSLQKKGYVLIFKEVTRRPGGDHKGNVDAELVLQAMIDYDHYQKAVLITSDGDFACLVRHLYDQDKLERVLSPSRAKASYLLRKAAQEKHYTMENLRKKLQYSPGA